MQPLWYNIGTQDREVLKAGASAQQRLLMVDGDQRSGGGQHWEVSFDWPGLPVTQGSTWLQPVWA